MTGKPWRPSMPEGARKLMDAFDQEMKDKYGAEARERHFDRKGNPISYADWAEAFSDYEYRVVKKTIIGDVEISTVWLGMDHGFRRNGPPIIFETMCFQRSDDGTREDFDFQDRYATEAQALKGHAEAVVAVEADLIKPRGDDEAHD